jgi:two-component system, NarL family, response regulator NreC
MSPHLRLAGVASGADSSSATPAGERSIRVLLAGQGAAIGPNLRQLLDGERDLEVIGEEGDLRALARRRRGRPPHVLVLDLGRSRGAYIRTIQGLREQWPDSHVVALTMDDDAVLARHALEAGARAFVLTEMADSDLPTAIRSAARGEQFVSPRVSKRPPARGRGTPAALRGPPGTRRGPPGTT